MSSKSHDMSGDMSSKTQESWEKEVMSLVVEMVEDVQDGYSFEIQPLYDLIRQLLAKQREEIKEALIDRACSNANKEPYTATVIPPEINSIIDKLK